MSAKKPKPIVIPSAVPDELKIPPCPDFDLHLGIKTPAVVAWWFEYFPVEAEVRYRGLTLP
jgi:hypothetical protein